MGLIKDEQKEQLREKFKELQGDVKLIVFTQEMECMYCEQTRELMEDIATLSDKITVEVYDFVADKGKAEEYKVDKIPATVVMGEKDYGIRFYGIPAGYEFVSLIDAINAVSRGETGLSDETKAALSQLKNDVHIQVFVTLTCPYCPAAVEMAHKLAMESEFITADMVESAEFPHLAQKYGVMAVPKTIVNEDTQFEGVLPEEEFVRNVLEASVGREAEIRKIQDVADANIRRYDLVKEQPKKEEEKVPELKKFTLEELAKYDGKEGRPAYVAYKGKVYDVSGSALWADADHMGMHEPGKDLTADMDDAPHEDDNILDMPVVGELEG